jgi:hypothetical protein
MQLSPDLSFAQLTCSETAEQRGIDNTAPPDVVESLKRPAAGFLTIYDTNEECLAGLRGHDGNRVAYPNRIPARAVTSI